MQKRNVMQLDKRLLIGQMLVGAMAHYTLDEIVKHKVLKYISAQLKKKHFDMKNGNSSDRFISNRDRDLEKRIAANKRIQKSQTIWNIHSNVANKAWVRTNNEIDFGVTISDLINAVLRKRPDVFKFYGFNKNKMKGYGAMTNLMSSAKVAQKLIDNLDTECAYYYEYIRKTSL